ncbi:MAG: ThuA domain-containing protein [Planctomycetota bacterium]
MRYLIIDGQNNHDWELTTPLLQTTLEMTGGRVSVLTAPRRGAPAEAWDSFDPRFPHFDVVISNYTDIMGGTAWPTAVLDQLCDWVISGGGFVSYHAAASAFLEHGGFWEIIGMGWREKGGHGKFGPFSVNVTELGSRHPITQAVAPGFEHAADEMWYGMTGPATEGKVSVEVLATARSPETLRDEPMIWTTRPGSGRCFVTVLGHDQTALASEGFNLTFVNGCQWASRNN